MKTFAYKISEQNTISSIEDIVWLKILLLKTSHQKLLEVQKYNRDFAVWNKVSVLIRLVVYYLNFKISSKEMKFLEYFWISGFEISPWFFAEKHRNFVRHIDWTTHQKSIMYYASFMFFINIFNLKSKRAHIITDFYTICCVSHYNLIRIS